MPRFWRKKRVKLLAHLKRGIGALGFDQDVTLRVGSVSGEYMGSVVISDKQESAHYVLDIDGQGSIGCMKGSAASGTA